MSGTLPKLVTFITNLTVLPGAVVFILLSTSGSSTILMSWNSIISTCSVIRSLILVPSYSSSLITSKTMVYWPARVFSGTLIVIGISWDSSLSNSSKRTLGISMSQTCVYPSESVID